MNLEWNGNKVSHINDSHDERNAESNSNLSHKGSMDSNKDERLLMELCCIYSSMHAPIKLDKLEKGQWTHLCTCLPNFVMLFAPEPPSEPGMMCEVSLLCGNSNHELGKFGLGDRCCLWNPVWREEEKVSKMSVKLVVKLCESHDRSLCFTPTKVSTKAIVSDQVTPMVCKRSLIDRKISSPTIEGYISTGKLKSLAKKTARAGAFSRAKRKIGREINDQDIEDNSTAITKTGNLILNESDEVPTERWGHTMTLLSRKHALLIGGQGMNRTFCRDSTYILDIESKQFLHLPTTTLVSRPDMRMGHSAVYDPLLKAVYVFGGCKNLRWFSDVHLLDTRTNQWELLKVDGDAPTRTYHSCILYRNELWIFGGLFPQPDLKPDGCSNDIHVFSPIHNCWYKPSLIGTPPAARFGHSANRVAEDKMVVFGGWDQPLVFNDLYILDLSLLEWSCPDVAGTPPSPRNWHSSCELMGNRILIQGGYDGNVSLSDAFIFNLDCMQWHKIRLSLSLPPLAGHSMICLPYNSSNDEKNETLIFGGGDNESSFSNKLFNLCLPIVHKSSSHAFMDISNQI